MGLVTDPFWDTWDRGTLSLRNIIMDLEHQKSLRESSARNQRVNTTVWNLNWSPSGRVKQVYMGPGMGGMQGVRLKDASYACSSQLGRMAWPLGPLVSWPRANKYDNTSVLLAVRKNGLHLVPLWKMKRKSMYRRLPLLVTIKIFDRWRWEAALITGYSGLMGSTFYPLNKYWAASNMQGTVSPTVSGEPRHLSPRLGGCV